MFRKLQANTLQVKVLQNTVRVFQIFVHIKCYYSVTKATLKRHLYKLPDEQSNNLPVPENRSNELILLLHS